MRELRLTWTPPGTGPRDGEPDTTGRALFGLHLAGSLMALLAAWPPGWRLGEPVLTDPFGTWWGAEAAFLSLAALQFGAGRWRSEPERRPVAEGAPSSESWAWLLLLVASVVPAGVAAYRVNPLPSPPPAILAAALGADLFFFASLGRTLRRWQLGEPSTGMAAWGLFLLVGAGVWLPGARAFEIIPGRAPLPALGPVPFPLLFDQPPISIGPWQLPLAAVTAAGWAAAGLAVRAGGRLLARRGRGLVP
ncbi:hypothetical protein [Limnochorda pilosa]|uniref:Uncharacterized protein n=1 Tax=Limnochorda pilosa TaxID=1555112 RepID=A0A0K2SQ68_LIMPI|nr:hypothetical protein [Limnochorda pilosa]BAS28979.1 hypothetical protein LIP_3152 [Limnochorda pilosa]